MSQSKTLSREALKILTYMVNKNACYGWDMMKGTKLPSADLYPALMRLENQGYIKSEWGNGKVKKRRRLYKITITGIEALKERANKCTTTIFVGSIK